MRRILLVITLLLMASACFGAACFGRPQPYVIMGALGHDPGYDRWSCDPNPRGLRVDLSTITGNYGMGGRISSPLSAVHRIENWQSKTTTVYYPHPTDPKRYTTRNIALIQVELQNKDGGAVYKGGLTGGTTSKTGEGPLVTFGAGESNSLVGRAGQRCIYQTGDSRLLGESRVYTVSSDGCFYCSLGMVVASYFGTGSTEYANWSSMKWMVDNDCFEGARLLPAVAAEKLSMRYSTQPATEAGMEAVHERGWRAVISMTGHFMYCVPLTGIATDGRILWDVIIDPNSTREGRFERDKSGNLKVWSGTNIPRLTVNPAYSGRLLDLRVFAPICRSRNCEVGSSIPYQLTRNGWWKEFPRTASTMTLGEAENPMLLGLRGISALTPEGITIDRVITPIGTIQTEGSIGPLSLWQEERTDDRWPEPYGDEELCSEFFGGDTSPSGIYSFYLKGTPNTPYRINLAWFNVMGVLSELTPAGTLDSQGIAKVDFSFAPGSMESVVWEISEFYELRSQPIGDNVRFEAQVEAVDASGLYCRMTEAPIGIRVNWSGGISAIPGDQLEIIGTIVSRDPEVVVQATETPPSMGYYGEIAPIIQTKGWTYGIRPLCRLVKIAGSLIIEGDIVRMTNGQETLTVLSMPASEAETMVGHTVVLSGILRANGSFERTE